MNNMYIKLINWSDEQITQVIEVLDKINKNWITTLTFEGISQEKES